jgi:hypothetical protein
MLPRFFAFAVFVNHNEAGGSLEPPSRPVPGNSRQLPSTWQRCRYLVTLPFGPVRNAIHHLDEVSPLAKLSNSVREHGIYGGLPWPAA